VVIPPTAIILAVCRRGYTILGIPTATDRRDAGADRGRGENPDGGFRVSLSTTAVSVVGNVIAASIGSLVVP
jgi:hypothetical protein